MKMWKLAAMAGMIATGTAAMAQDGNDWAVQFVNGSTYTVTAIHTQRTDGQWSANWVRTPIRPSQRVAMNFADPNDTRCQVLTRVTFSNEEYFQEQVDYCAKDYLVVTDEAMSSR